MPLRAAVNIFGRPECSCRGRFCCPLLSEDERAIFPLDQACTQPPFQSCHHDNLLHFLKFWSKKGRFVSIFLFFQEDHEIQTDKAQKSFQPNR